MPVLDELPGIRTLDGTLRMVVDGGLPGSSMDHQLCSIPCIFFSSPPKAYCVSIQYPQAAWPHHPRPPLHPAPPFGSSTLARPRPTAIAIAISAWRWIGSLSSLVLVPSSSSPSPRPQPQDDSALVVGLGLPGSSVACLGYYTTRRPSFGKRCPGITALLPVALGRLCHCPSPPRRFGMDAMDASHGTREQGILGMGICTDMGWESERSIAHTWRNMGLAIDGTLGTVSIVRTGYECLVPSSLSTIPFET